MSRFDLNRQQPPAVNLRDSALTPLAGDVNRFSAALSCDFLSVGTARGAGEVICDLGLAREGLNRFSAALSCDFLSVGRLTGSVKSFVIWVSQGEDKKSTGPVTADVLEGAFDLGDPCEAFVLVSAPISSFHRRRSSLCYPTNVSYDVTVTVTRDDGCRPDPVEFAVAAEPAALLLRPGAALCRASTAGPALPGQHCHLQ
jgi:hypothetical protein